ncbi:MAG: zinc-dependent peptidase [Phycisphaerales bacterium]
MFPVLNLFGLRTRSRRRLLRKPVPAGWREIVEANIERFHLLPPAQQERLLELTRIFISEKSFEGVGIKMTDEVRLTIAAHAVTLLLNRYTDPRDSVFSGVRAVIVYPNRYRAAVSTIGPGGVVTEGNQIRLGEAWHGPGTGGSIVLSWEDVPRADRSGVCFEGRPRPMHAHNVVIHEFAHALDAENGDVNGAPKLDRPGAYKSWSATMSREFVGLRRAAALGLPTLLSAYGATNPAEFFAVATETFFDRPIEMRQHHPELYAQLEGFYGSADTLIANRTNSSTV